MALAYGPTPAVCGVDLTIEPHEIIVLTGSSGSGKTSLLYCLAGLVMPDRGVVTYGGRPLAGMDDRALSCLRSTDFGFVFQFGELVPELTLLENVALPLQLAGVGRAAAQHDSRKLLGHLGIGAQADRRSTEVSGGQAQRAAVARALVHRPRVVFADEPTGSLDSDNKRSVLREFVRLARDHGAAVVMVTHEPQAAAFADRRLAMVDGRLVDSPAA